MRKFLWIVALVASLACILFVIGNTAEAQQASYTIVRTEEPGRCGAALEVQSDLNIQGLVATVEYDPEKLAFESVTLSPGLVSSWQIERVNVGPFAGCDPPAGRAWVLVSAAAVDFTAGVAGSFQALRFTFTPESCGSFDLGLPACTDGVRVTQNATSAQLWPFSPLAPYENLALYPASVHSDCLVPVEAFSWTGAKRLFR